MTIIWNPRISIGHDHIDSQHRELIDHYNAFLKACSDKMDKQELLRLFGFLDRYVQEHFSDEEALMHQHGYPLATEHCQEHRKLTEALHSLKEKLEESHTLSVIMDTSHMLMTWVLEHIGKEDVALGEHLQQC
jgi:hemerythrin